MSDIQDMGFTPEDENKIRQLAARLDAAGLAIGYDTSVALGKIILLSESIETTRNRMGQLRDKFDAIKANASERFSDYTAKRVDAADSGDGA